MNNWVNLLRGSVRVEVRGAFPERFVNLCAQRGIAFWAVEWLEGGAVRLTAAGPDRRKLKPLAEKAMCELEEVTEDGLPFFLLRFRKRYTFFIGLVCALAAVCILSQFVLTIDVSGNETVPTAQILAELRRQGLKTGSYGPALDSSLICHEALLQLPDLSWMTINLHGTRAQVLVREAVQAPEPEPGSAADRSVLGDIVADAPGIITQLEVWEGQARVQKGDTVSKGDVIISGNIILPLPEYSELEPEVMRVGARGLITARTWRSLSAQIPLEAQVKRYTGQKQIRWGLFLLGGRMNFYQNSGIPFPEYDKINDTWTLSLPHGQTMPLALVRETAREYTLETVPLDRDAAQELLQARLSTALEQELLPDGSIISTNYAASVQDGTLTVTLRAECMEKIGRFVPAQS